MLKHQLLDGLRVLALQIPVCLKIIIQGPLDIAQPRFHEFLKREMQHASKINVHCSDRHRHVIAKEWGCSVTY